MYSLKATDMPEVITNYMLDPPDGKNPLDLIDAYTISIRISENNEVYNTDGGRITKTYQTNG